MKRRFTEEQIIRPLREQEAGGTVREIIRRLAGPLWTDVAEFSVSWI